MEYTYLKNVLNDLEIKTPSSTSINKLLDIVHELLFSGCLPGAPNFMKALYIWWA